MSILDRTRLRSGLLLSERAMTHERILVKRAREFSNPLLANQPALHAVF